MIGVVKQEKGLSMNTDLFKIVKEHLHNQASDVKISTELAFLAKTHQLAPMLYYQTRDKALYHFYLQAVSAYTQRKTILEQITDAFSEIPFYIVKGFSISQYYPIPQLRTMGDCDIIVRECDKEKVKDILLAMGFEDHTSKWDDMEWHFVKQGLDFEIHHRLLYDETVIKDQEKAFADKGWDYVENHELDVNFHFVFLLLHLKKHLLNRGVGIRQFVDLAVMSKNNYIDKNQVAAFLKQTGMERFAEICSALCLRWFGVSLPVDTPEISDEFYNKATETILYSGVFGFEVQDQEEKRLLNNVNKFGKVSSITGYIFPSYKTCCITPKYKWIKGKPFLMPVFWIYRIVWALFKGKSKSSVEYMSAVANSDKAMAERRKELAAWGL